MANMKSSLASLWTTTQTLLDTSTEVIKSASIGVNEISDRTRDWALVSRVDRESTREKRVLDRVDQRLMDLSKAKAKRQAELTKDPELATVYAEMSADVYAKVKELMD